MTAFKQNRTSAVIVIYHCIYIFWESLSNTNKARDDNAVVATTVQDPNGILWEEE